MKRFETWAAWLFGLIFIGLAFAVAVETTMRKLFNRSLQGVDELGGYTLAVGAALSFAVALGARAHIRIDLVHDRLPRALRIGLNGLALLALAACAAALAWMAWYALDESILFNATAQTPWATPLRIPQSIWLAALAVFGLVCLIEIGRFMTAFAQGRWDRLDRRFGPRGSKEELEEELADLKTRGLIADPALPIDSVVERARS